mmetsp:Transcript_18667/g.50632  ORF Transcript_18667/g.50632 Transcript_18667/m.50632 type:complete len:244 (+) Transcript_18667:738-1469(+)
MKLGFLPVISPTNLFARTMSRVVIPTIFAGSRPFFLYNSAIAGTTEFTGFTISAMTASGQNLAQAETRPFAMSAFTLKRSSRDMPGFRGIPAGIRTRWQSLRHSSQCSLAFAPTSIMYPLTEHLRSMWLRSAATPAGGTMATLRSKTLSSFTFGSMPMRSESGWPMPPAPPSTQTLNAPAGLGSLAFAFAFAFAFALAFGSAFSAGSAFAFALTFAFACAFGSSSAFALALPFFDFTGVHSSQ